MSGKEYAGDCFEDGALACRLDSNNGNLRELDIIQLGELEFVKQIKETLLLICEVLVLEGRANRERISRSADPIS